MTERLEIHIVTSYDFLDASARLFKEQLILDCARESTRQHSPNAWKANQAHRCGVSRKLVSKFSQIWPVRLLLLT